MPRLTGPDFIGIQTEDLPAARAFYGDRLGLPVLQQTPDAVVFDSKPVPFAVRKPLMDLEAAQGNWVHHTAPWRIPYWASGRRSRTDCRRCGRQWRA